MSGLIYVHKGVDMSYNHIVSYALRKIWAAPRQDMQSIIKPKRLTGVTGAFNRVRVMWETYDLPMTKTRFHVYQIGQLHPALLGILNIDQQWVSTATCCEETNMLIDTYLSNGRMFPKSTVWYMVTKDKNVIIAVQDQPKISEALGTDDLYFRFYSNAYFGSTASGGDIYDVKIQYGAPKTNAEILALQNTFEYYQNFGAQFGGAVFAFINGLLVETINLLNVATDDIVEVIFDASIKKVLDISISELPTFDSDLDLIRKYLLLWDEGSENAYYHDDIDFYLVNGTLAKPKGVYLHRNAGNTVRNVTHQAYSIGISYIDALTVANAWPEADLLKLKVFVRKGGRSQTLVYENNRIAELMKLPYAKRLNAMVGVNSTNEVWRANVLESSAYAEVVRSDARVITPALVESALGYNAMAKVLGDGPCKVYLSSGQKIVDVPYGLWKNSTGYEYDSAWKLLGWYNHIESSIYACRNIGAAYVEIIPGVSSTSFDENYSVQDQTIDPKRNYRFYVCDIVDGLPTNEWEDVTEHGGMYLIDDNTVKWAVDFTKKATLVRSDYNVLSYKLSLMANDGVLTFTLAHDVYRDENVHSQLMQIPGRHIDLFLEGRPIIEGIDYKIDFPKVVIFNKEYLNNPSTKAQAVVVRVSGLCDSDLKHEVPEEVGFIQFGLLSNNDRFDIRDDRVIRIVVDGAIKTRDALKFAETDTGVQIDAANGAPYCIRDVIIPTKEFGVTDTFVLRDKAKVIDAAVSDYMTMYSDIPAKPENFTITDRYKVYSPFLNKIISDLNNGYLSDNRLLQHYNDSLVAELCASYEWLLEFDPTQEANQIDDRYVVVHPHNLFTVVELDIYHMKFILRVVDYYMKGKVDTSMYLRIKNYGLED